MVKEAIYHVPYDNYLYTHDGYVYLRLRAKKNDLKSCKVYITERYDYNNVYYAGMDLIARDNLFDYFEVKLKLDINRIRYAFLLTDINSEPVWYSETGFFENMPDDFFNYPYMYKNDEINIPKWAYEAVFYQIFPERFNNGNKSNDPENIKNWHDEDVKSGSFYGGDIAGICKRIPYLKELGVNALYLTPVFKSPSNHKYDTTDYYEIDPHFGDKETVKSFVKTCHASGIRVIFDAVFNHSGIGFDKFQDVMANGEESPYKDWFYVHEFPVSTQPKANYETFAYAAGMPKINTSNPDVIRYLTDVAVYWIKEADIDGWRLDVANEIDHGFLKELRKKVKEVKSDAFIIGEIWHNSLPWLLGDQFDSVMNYPFTNLLKRFFAYKNIDPSTFDKGISALRAMYATPYIYSLFNIIDSHDTPRFINECGFNKESLKSAVLFQMTYFGVPCVYYGDELGMTGGGDPLCRKPMVWDESMQDRELFGYYKKLVNLRKKHLSLRYGSFKSLIKDDMRKIYAYTRENDNERFLAVYNNSGKNQDVSIAVGNTGNPNGIYKDILENAFILCVKGVMQVNIPAYKCALIEL